MRIVNVSSGIIRMPPNTLGGGEGLLFSLAKQFAGMGHEAIIIDRKYSKREVDIEEVEGVEILRLPMPLSDLLLKGSKAGGLIRTLCLKLSRILFAIKVARYLNGGSGELAINVNDTYMGVIFSFLLKSELRARVFFTLSSHTFYRRSYASSGRLGAFLYHLMIFLGKYALKRLRCVIVANETALAEFKEKMKLNNVRLIPHGVEPEIFNGEVDAERFKTKFGVLEKKIILSVGRVNWEKGGDVLVKAAHYLMNQLNCKDCVLLIVGPFGEFTTPKNPDRFTQHLRQIVESEGLKEKVKHTGMLPLNELLQAFKACDIFVSPSRVENFGMVITEAISAAKPVVSTKHPGALMQIKDGWNGFLVEVEDYQALAKKIKFLLDNPKLAEEMGENAKMSAKEFDWQKIAEKYVEAYEG